jgi:hypothetical protein
MRRRAAETLQALEVPYTVNGTRQTSVQEGELATVTTANDATSVRARPQAVVEPPNIPEPMPVPSEPPGPVTVPEPSPVPSEPPMPVPAPDPTPEPSPPQPEPPPQAG